MNKKEIAELKDIVKALQKKQVELEKRIIELESQPIDKRFKEECIKVLGFTLIKSGDYYHAVKTFDGSQYRIYIGKNIEDLSFVEGKINMWFKNNSWAKRVKEVTQPKSVKKAKRSKVKTKRSKTKIKKSTK